MFWYSLELDIVADTTRDHGVRRETRKGERRVNSQHTDDTSSDFKGTAA